ncbi:MAG: ABC transporter permease [Thermoleophilia bacterium]|nr:ABC transporter permease [Thermoleophilia bacterium]
MIAYALRRLLIQLPILLVFSFVMYLVLFHAADPKARLQQIPGARAEDIQRIIEQQGLDKTWYEGYWGWLGDFVQGDWGASFSNKAVGAATLIWDRLPATLELMLVSLLLSILIAAPIGIYSALRRYTPFDYATTAFSYIGFAMPTFLLGLLLQMFAIWSQQNGWAVIPFTIGLILVLATVTTLLKPQRSSRGIAITAGVGFVLIWMSLAFWGSFGGDGQLIFKTAGRFTDAANGSMFSVDHLQHLALPVITLAVVNIAAWSRYQRSATIDVLSADYLRTARAKGLPERTVIGRHALRNALLPLITIVAIDIGFAFSGAVVTETVFGWPGIGRLLYDAALDGDITVAMGVIMLGAFMIVVFNLIADLAYAIADPRIRLA